MVEIRAQVAAQPAETDEVEIARQRLASLNPPNNAYFTAFNVFANELMVRFARSGNLNDIDEVVSRTKQVLDLAPSGHFFHAAALCLIGMALTKRFKFLGDTNDLIQSVSYLEAAVESCTPEQPLYLPFLGNLASGLLNRYWLFGDVADLNRIVETVSPALSTSLGHTSSRDTLLNNLATALKERFEKQGKNVDLDTALTHYQSCLDLRPPGHPFRSSVLGNIAALMLLKFEVDGRQQDLEGAANYYVSALQLRSPGEEGYLLCLTSLGIVYGYLFGLEGNIERLETAINLYQTAMEHSKVPNLDHSRLLDNYSAALHSRYTLFGNIDDLDQAIQYLTTSCDILPPTYSGRHNTLSNLGLVLATRFQATGNIANLGASIENLTLALQLCTPNDHQRPVILSVYGNALSARFRARGDIQDLTLAISACNDALTLASPNKWGYPAIMSSLTSTLLDCFRRTGNAEEYQTVIDHCDRALVSTRPGDPAFISLTINRAGAFIEKFQFEVEKEYIDTSIAAIREVIHTIAEGHTEYVRANLQLGIALATRFKRGGNIVNLHESIEFLCVSRRHCKRGNSCYVPVCINLGDALREHFEYHLNDSILDEAMVLLAEAEEILSPTPEHIDYKLCLVDLGVALVTRFRAQRIRIDLDTAIERVSLALTLPTSGEDFLVAFTLSMLLFLRHTEDNKLEDLSRCGELLDAAAKQMPSKHLLRGNLYTAYAQALVRLASYRDHLQNINAAIYFFMEALQLSSPAHYEQEMLSVQLAYALYKRAKHLRDTSDRDNAIWISRRLVQTASKDGSTFHSICHCAAELSVSVYMDSQYWEQDPSFMEEGFRYYEKATGCTYAFSSTHVSTALQWANYAEKLHHSSTLLAYKTSLVLLSQHLLATTSIERRHSALLDKNWVKQTSTLATDATACAIAKSELTLAVELSEQGRGLLWSQLSQSRTPLDALQSTSDTGRALAFDFKRVTAQLVRDSVAPTWTHPTVTASQRSLEEAARRYRQLTKELEDVIARIRQQEGFQSFLDRPSFESLQPAAAGGPVILVNISRQRCDAIIVLHDAPPRLVPLPDTSLEELTTLSARFYQVLKKTSGVGEEKMREREVVVVLRTLWDTIVRPIVDELTPFVPRGARIWWCPTSKLTTLPLHAAGPYRKGAPNLTNIYVSSYTPTLAALIRARQSQSSSSSSPPGFIAIGQAKPTSSTGPALQTVSAELALVQSLLPRPVSAETFSALDGEASTADAALAALSTHGWAHLACHGHPNVERPFDAAFALSDRAVTILDVVRARGIAQVDASTDAGTVEHDGDPIPGEFAFLSACHTAVGDRQAPDEIIHLAAAMQHVGFRSVIGTMWAVDDGMAQYMVRAFYECMFPRDGPKDGGSDDPWDCTRAARALNRGAKSVDKDLVSFDQRIVFIHIGA